MPQTQGREVPGAEGWDASPLRIQMSLNGPAANTPRAGPSGRKRFLHSPIPVLEVGSLPRDVSVGAFLRRQSCVAPPAPRGEPARGS